MNQTNSCTGLCSGPIRDRLDRLDMNLLLLFIRSHVELEEAIECARQSANVTNNTENFCWSSESCVTE